MVRSAQTAINDQLKKLGQYAWQKGEPAPSMFDPAATGGGNLVTYTASSTVPATSYTAQQVLQNTQASQNK